MTSLHFTRRRACALVVGAVSAGCLSEFSPEPGSTNDSTDDPTDEPGTSPPTIGDPDPESCPDLGDGVDRVVCYDDVDPDDQDIVLRPNADRVSPGEPVTFALANGTDATLAINFYDWSIEKYVDGAWFHVVPREVPEPLMSIPPGESHAWTVTMDAGDVADGGSVTHAGGTDELYVDGVGAGRYAFAARGWFEDGGPDGKLGFAATFELDGDPLPLTTTDAIEEIDRDGDALVARSSRGDPDDEYAPPAELELERVDEPAEKPTKVIVEQLVRDDPLRDAFALAAEYDVDRVTLREYTSATPPFGSQIEGVYEFRGEFYRVSTRELEE